MLTLGGCIMDRKRAIVFFGATVSTLLQDLHAFMKPLALIMSFRNTCMQDLSSFLADTR